MIKASKRNRQFTVHVKGRYVGTIFAGRCLDYGPRHAYPHGYYELLRSGRIIAILDKENGLEVRTPTTSYAVEHVKPETAVNA